MFDRLSLRILVTGPGDLPTLQAGEKTSFYFFCREYGKGRGYGSFCRIFVGVREMEERL